MSVELDEVYLASIKEMFKDFDDEIIWSSIFEHGFDKNGNYKLENVVNYLLELSDSTKETKYKVIIPESNINKDKEILENNEINDNSKETDNLIINNDDNIDNFSIFQNFLNFIKNENDYQKIDDNL